MSAFHDVLFPTTISYGSVGGHGFSTAIIPVDSGVEERVARWSRPRRRYDVAYGIKTYTQLQAVRDFYVARSGPLNSFRFRDPLDYSTSASVTPDIDWPSANLHTNVDALLGVGDGTTTTFQLRKEYTSGSTTAYVPITKPVSGTVKVSLDAVDQSSGWSVNLTTGVITFTVAPSAAVIVKAGCEFDIEARFGAEVDASLPISADQFSIGSVRSIPLIEVISGNTVNEERLALGGGRKAFTSSISIAQHEGITWELTPASSGLVVTVETAADLPSGGPHYMFYNAGADSLTLKGGAATIATLAAGADATLWIWKVAGVNTWKAVT